MTRTGRRSASAPVCLAGTFLLLAIGAGPAAAHTDLESSTPRAGAVLDQTPSEVVLAFTEEMDPALGAVVLRVDGRRVGRLNLASGELATELVAAVDPARLPDAGVARWRVDYRVTSRDGHPVTGSLSFRAPTGAPSNAETGEATGEESGEEAEAESSSDKEPASLVNVLAVAAVVVLVLVLALVALRRVGREEERQFSHDEEPET